MTDFACNYGGALYSLAEETGKTSEILEDLNLVESVLGANGEYVKLLDTPSVTAEEKGGLIDAAFGGRVNEFTLNFIKILSDKRAVRTFFDCKKEFTKQYNKANNIENAVVITATEISTETKTRIKEKLEKMTGKKIILENKIDKGIIGGMVIRMANKQMDASVKTKLDELLGQISAF